MTNLISIVMPAYNASSYIEEALNSIVSQTYVNWELIVVDDCSTDDTLRILTEYEERDSRVRVFRLEKNSGSAKYPRDLAVSYANGDLICWIDADDVIPASYIQELVDKKISSGANIVCSTMSAFSGNNLSDELYQLPPSVHPYPQSPISGLKAVMYSIGDFWRINANGWLCDRILWLKTSTFLDKGKVWMNVDDLSTREMLIMADSVAFSNVLYYYRVYQNSITKKISPKLFEALITDEAVCELFVKSFGRDSKQHVAAVKQYYSRIAALKNKYKLIRKDFTVDERRRVLNLLNMSKKRIQLCQLFSLPISMKRKLVLIGIKIGLC